VKNVFHFGRTITRNFLSWLVITTRYRAHETIIHLFNPLIQPSPSACSTTNMSNISEVTPTPTSTLANDIGVAVVEWLNDALKLSGFSAQFRELQELIAKAHHNVRAMGLQLNTFQDQMKLYGRQAARSPPVDGSVTKFNDASAEHQRVAATRTNLIERIPLLETAKNKSVEVFQTHHAQLLAELPLIQDLLEKAKIPPSDALQKVFADVCNLTHSTMSSSYEFFASDVNRAKHQITNCFQDLTYDALRKQISDAKVLDEQVAKQFAELQASVDDLKKRMAMRSQAGPSTQPAQPAPSAQAPSASSS
jgi:hypothetical protein